MTLLLPDVTSGWAESLSLVPGAHLIAVMREDVLAVEGRLAGLELRDTLVVISPTESRFAVLYRKPLGADSILAQLDATGTGALNIDATRIASDGSHMVRTVRGRSGGMTPGDKREGASLGMFQPGKGFQPTNHPGGRWPPNVVFVHTEGCHRLSGHRGWSCSTSCTIPSLDEQSGVRPSTLTGRADPTIAHANPGDNHGASWFGGGNSNVYADTGGAARYYPQFANDAELFDWLTRLVTPAHE